MSRTLRWVDTRAAGVRSRALKLGILPPAPGWRLDASRVIHALRGVPSLPPWLACRVLGHVMTRRPLPVGGPWRGQSASPVSVWSAGGAWCRGFEPLAARFAAVMALWYPLFWRIAPTRFLAAVPSCRTALMYFPWRTRCALTFAESFRRARAFLASCGREVVCRAE